MKNLIWVVLLLNGCASWYMAPDELAELESRRKLPENCHIEWFSGFPNMECETSFSSDCTEIEDGIAICGKLRTTLGVR